MTPPDFAQRSHVARILSWLGLAGMVMGAIDPLEGSVIILLGTALAALGAWLGQSRYQSWLICAFLLTAVGVGLLFYISSLGGLGGNTGRSMWWSLLFLPYPIGWIMGLLGVARIIWVRPRPGLQKRTA